MLLDIKFELELVMVVCYDSFCVLGLISLQIYVCFFIFYFFFVCVFVFVFVFFFF